MMSDLDREYALLVDKMDYSRPHYYEGALRRLSSMGHPESMNLLAIILGDIDNVLHRGEIIELYQRAHELGSACAAENLRLDRAKWAEQEN